MADHAFRHLIILQVVSFITEVDADDAVKQLCKICRSACMTIQARRRKGGLPGLREEGSGR